MPVKTIVFLLYIAAAVFAVIGAFWPERRGVLACVALVLAFLGLAVQAGIPA